ncbi:MAG: M35 family metallopeptidase [Gammaproteobacteria bacterium]|nr:M35 family metallopeptidase [Gammaproteobacteria bacterium]MBU1443699.1 M35 family metallopeptidase [Gammaproteobacteria bacterium]MBU2288004.1 M35 family metallopeptidase [Gammaproteobacteria bacterium]MBU2410052.1 M35 family metallopeptidase [Gammaproteobacteria bacterium]
MPDFSKDISIKKPTAALHDANLAIRGKLGLQVPTDPRRGFTDRMEALSHSVMIGYKNRPSAAEMAATVVACQLAGRVMKKVNDQFASVSFLRKSETQLMKDVLDAHFGLVEGDTAGGYLKDNVADKGFSLKSIKGKDRRWVIEKLRRNMLSLSFHLNTGIYLIDIDAARRDISGGQAVAAGSIKSTTEAYVGNVKDAKDPVTGRTTSWKAASDITCGFTRGEMHVSFKEMATYSPLSYARVIIHEATHKYLNTTDHGNDGYAHSAQYRTLSLTDCLKNADSHAWAAISLYAGAVKMKEQVDYWTDWKQCQKP